jgi:hypothetical protein
MNPQARRDAPMWVVETELGTWRPIVVTLGPFPEEHDGFCNLGKIYMTPKTAKQFIKDIEAAIKKARKPAEKWRRRDGTRWQ